MPPQPVDALTGEVTELLQCLIRNACVNDGSLASGHEHRSADTLSAMLSGPGCDLAQFEPQPGRTSLVARIEGSDPHAPTLVLMGHTDVVPANAAGWRHDPFGGELIEGEVWGRGAVDMLNLTSSMAVAFRRLAASGFRPAGTLVYLAVADEEAGGIHGAEWLIGHESDLVAADYVVTEWGGIPLPSPAGPCLGVSVAEKGIAWCRLRVRGTPGHGSRPLRTDNALVKAAAVVARVAAYRPETRVHDVWRRYAEGLGLDEALVDPERVWDACQGLDDVALARQAHACTHTTFSPNVVMGSTKTNVIPDRVDVEIDIRTLPGHGLPEVRAMLEEALGSLAGDVEITFLHVVAATTSPSESALWESLQRVVADLHPGARLVPSMSTGGTDARFFRHAGAVAYGFGLLSHRVSPQSFAAMFHGNDERVDQESLRLSAELWSALAIDLLS